MNPEIKAQWVSALRSGEYNQAKGALKYVTANGSASYCCLGVLCELAIREDVIPEPDETSSNSWHYGKGWTGSATSLPREVSTWAGLTEDDAAYAVNDPYVSIPNGPHNRSLSNLNDTGYTFEEIATLIEDYL